MTESPDIKTDVDPFNMALARYVEDQENLSYTPEIVSTDFDGGGDCQIGDYTWDHDNALFIVFYKVSDLQHNKVFRLDIDLERYEGGFAQLVRDIVKFWQ